MDTETKDRKTDLRLDVIHLALNIAQHNAQDGSISVEEVISTANTLLRFIQNKKDKKPVEEVAVEEVAVESKAKKIGKNLKINPASLLK